MKYLLIFIAGGLGYWLGARFAQNKTKHSNILACTERSRSENVGMFKTVAGRKKEERKKKILDLLSEKEKITNDDVQKLLGIADSTATNYLDELEKEGLVVQKGETGRFVYYEKSS